MCGRQVKLCDPVVTHGPYLRALEIKVLDKFICLFYLTGTLLETEEHVSIGANFISAAASCF